MSDYEADDDARRLRHSRGYSPEHRSAADRTAPYGHGGQPQQQDQHRGLNQDYFRESASELGVPAAAGPRSRSVPPPSSAVVRRPRSPSRSSRSSSRSYRGRGLEEESRGNRSRAESQDPDALGRARHVVHDNFSHSAAGIGAGILGAVVGGIIANKASEAALRHKHRTDGRARRRSDEATPRMVSTILGAVAGGLGANAIANKVEDSRDSGHTRQLAWEEGHGREGHVSRHDSRRFRELDDGHRRSHRGHYDDGGDDSDYDYVYDDDRRSSRNRHTRRHRHHDDDGYRY